MHYNTIKPRGTALHSRRTIRLLRQTFAASLRLPGSCKRQLILTVAIRLTFRRFWAATFRAALAAWGTDKTTSAVIGLHMLQKHRARQHMHALHFPVALSCLSGCGRNPAIYANTGSLNCTACLRVPPTTRFTTTKNRMQCFNGQSTLSLTRLALSVRG